MAAEAKLNKVQFVANELQPHRAKLVQQALEPIDRLISVAVEDGRKIGEATPHRYDRILLDAPCTGLGALRRRPEARWRKQPNDVAELATLQQELLASAWAALKPGGILAYVTCSPHQGETTAIIDWGQKKLGEGFELLDTNAVLAEINPNLHLNRKRKTAQLWPDLNHTDAMFVALIKKAK
jgi:16S rRNA (cytosine967-C5)-methyltransferase